LSQKLSIRKILTKGKIIANSEFTINSKPNKCLPKVNQFTLVLHEEHLDNFPRVIPPTQRQMNKRAKKNNSKA